jgi:hypothetical protein
MSNTRRYWILAGVEGVQRDMARARKPLMSSLVSALCISLAACGEWAEPKFSENPNPRMHDKVTITFVDAPGPFSWIQADASYDVSDYSCVPEQPLSGARLLPSKTVPLKLRKTSETTYETDVYLDLMKDEDYYSKGVCHWSLSSVSASAVHRRMRFETILSRLSHPGHAVETRYFSFASYQDSHETMLNTGNADRNAYPDPSRTFSIRVEAEAVH